MQKERISRIETLRYTNRLYSAHTHTVETQFPLFKQFFAQTDSSQPGTGIIKQTTWVIQLPLSLSALSNIHISIPLM